MKHFFGYTSDGKLWWTFVHTGGYSDACNLDDPNCTDPLAVHLKANYGVNQQHSETLDGFVRYDCPCDPEVGICECAPTKRDEAYYSGSALTDKPLVDVIITGQVIACDDNITKYPNSVFTVKLQEITPSTMPDGETAIVMSSELLEGDTAELTFTNGVTDEVTLRAPAQGVTANLTVNGNMMKFCRIYVKGFVST